MSWRLFFLLFLFISFFSVFPFSYSFLWWAYCSSFRSRSQCICKKITGWEFASLYTSRNLNLNRFGDVAYKNLKKLIRNWINYVRFDKNGEQREFVTELFLVWIMIFITIKSIVVILHLCFYENGNNGIIFCLHTKELI